MNAEEVQKVAAFCREKLDLAALDVRPEYGYAHLPLCVIDTVFSIGVRYTSTRNVVARFCAYFKLDAANSTNQFAMTPFLKIYEDYGVERLAKEIYQSRQRTSPRGGILKAEAVQRFSQVLAQQGVETLQDIPLIFEKPAFEAHIKAIPGQRSGISLQYFYMLVGSEEYVKADRMISRFIYAALGKNYGVDESRRLIVAAAHILKVEFPTITPRNLDSAIWSARADL